MTLAYLPNDALYWAYHVADIVICEPGTFICFICINKGMVTECLSSFPKRKLRFEPRLLRFKKLDSLPHFTLVIA